MTAEPAPTSRKNVLSWVEDDPAFTGLLLVLFVFVAYVVGAMFGTFHFDDFHNCRENPWVTSLANVPKFFADPATWSAEPGNTMYRPVLMTSYALDHAIWGFRPAGWLLTNILFHACVSVLVWRLARRIGLSPLAAFFAGIVAALHPIHAEVVNYVSARSESLAALMALGAIHLHLSARERTGGARILRIALAAALAGLSLLAKETTALLFLAVFWWEFVRARETTPAVRVRAALVAALPFAVAFAGAMALRGALLSHATAPVALVATDPNADFKTGGQMSILDNVLLVQSRVVVLYLQALLRPAALNVDYDVSRVPVFTASVAAALAIHLAVAAWAVRDLVRGRRLLPLCVGWFWLFLAPSIAYPLNVVMNDHRLYLPGIAVALLAGAALARVTSLISVGVRPLPLGAAAAVGAVLAIGMNVQSSAVSGAASVAGVALAAEAWFLIAAWCSSRRAGLVAVLVPAAVLGLFVPLAVQRSLEWKSDITLWTVGVQRAPGSSRAHMHLGAALHSEYMRPPSETKVELLREAIREYNRARDIYPGDSQTLLNLGSACIDLGRATDDPSCYMTSLGVFDEAQRAMGSRATRPRLLKAVALAELGKCDEALAIFSELRAADTSKTTLYDDFMGRVLRKAGRKAEGEAAMRRVIEIEEPEGRVEGLLTLGWWKLEDGDVESAEKLIGRAIDLVKSGKSREFRPYLYAVRLMRVLGVTGQEALVAQFLGNAQKLGWIAPPEEVRWVEGGPTPGAIRGTRGVPAYGLR